MGRDGRQKGLTFMGLRIRSLEDRVQEDKTSTKYLKYIDINWFVYMNFQITLGKHREEVKQKPLL